ncbi:hypothetical protein F4802DRAFT_619426, partial [Xylaria palmicola]
GHSSSKSASQLSFSFLFVVNQLKIHPDAIPHVDQWGSRMPPEYAHEYEGERVGTVWRYRDGDIEPARGYAWHREEGVDADTGLRPEGTIVRYDDDDDAAVWPLPEYSKFTVFNCWGPLPCVYSRADALSTPMGPYGDGARWHLMSFDHHDGSGVTRVAEAGNAQTVAGRSPSWMPGLVPALFKNPGRDLGPSNGLAGELGVLIGQMALAEPYKHTDKPFEHRWWRNGQWSPSIGRASVEHPLDLRGVLVAVYLDSLENEVGSTEANMQCFERGVIIRE